MVILGGWVFLMSEVLLYSGGREMRADCPTNQRDTRASGPYGPPWYWAATAYRGQCHRPNYPVPSPVTYDRGRYSGGREQHANCLLRRPSRAGRDHISSFKDVYLNPRPDAGPGLLKRSA